MHPVSIKFHDTTSKDAFGRLRISAPFDLFSNKNIHDRRKNQWEEPIIGAIIEHGAVTGGPFQVAETITGGTSGTIGTVTGCMDLRDADDVFVAFIERVAAACTVSTCVQYCADVPLLIRVRRKGIKPFQTTGCFAATGFSTGAIRTTCSVVDLP